MAVPSDGNGPAECWEICEDDGFIYKRRYHPVDQAFVASDAAAKAPEATEESEAELRRWRRQQKLSCLKGLRDKYKKELEKWERLSSAGNQLSEQVPERPSVDLRSQKVDGSQATRQMENLGHHHSVDELLIQVECQEAIFRKIEEICSDVDALGEEKEENLANLLIELPIWSSPRTLLKSLSS
ncbi:hypothetical protein FCM35_KLT18601 [Carex littledalei]|uniref:Uncharacterized protein n=1 Tax=Carex littledalei TaxID=544730 RepID=A0A833RPR2_9POAL|nr:hypothetical protein FCM35_KLT18601 [Carex littledalei]